jgi:uncharacterized iron-regulated membrane protein
MGELAFTGGAGGGTTVAATRDGVDDEAADRASRRWRTLWRVHFYAGILAAPIMVLLALTGLVILYTQPLQHALEGDVRLVTPQGQAVAYDDQLAAVAEAFPDQAVVSMVTPFDDRHATAFGLEDGRDAFVDPWTGEVLGTADPDGGIVGLANRLHGNLNNEGLTVPLPMLGGLFGDDEAFAPVPLGDVVVEIFACWALVLAASGIYLWWPRKRDTGKALFVPRLARRGRARWRDLHAVPGIVLSFVLAFFVISGLPWSGFWGANYGWAAERITPGSAAEPPASTVAELGDLDRFGNRINWALKDAPVPASNPGGGDHAGHGGGGAPGQGAAGAAVDGPLPAQLSLDGIVRAGRDEGLMPGFAVAFPEDVEGDDGSVVHGTFAASNPWPATSQQALTVSFDQFSGETIGRQELYGSGAIGRATDYTVSTHMGTQLGLVNRIVMTLGCLLLLWAVISALVMYTKRRRPGSLGLPRRPRDLRLGNRLVVIGAVLAVLYPLWGLSLLAVLAFDRFVIRRARPLRAAFGQP